MKASWNRISVVRRHSLAAICRVWRTRGAGVDGTGSPEKRIYPLRDFGVPRI
jgi:hypothetical protein